MAKTNFLKVGFYAATGKMLGKLPVKGTASVALRAAEEGIVLLKNSGLLPLKERKVALFGAGSKDTAVCGTGSGYAFSPYTVTVYDGLVKAGYEITSTLWLDNYDKKKKEIAKKDKSLSFLDIRFSGVTPYFDVDIITGEELEGASAASVAVYVIKRNTGEGYDRKPVKGDYYLSDNEKKNIELLAEKFGRVAVILNTCVIDCSWLEESEAVSALVLMGQPGLEAGTALANILSGKVSPSGRLTDTFAKCYEDYPASGSFSLNDGTPFQEDYTEDIFVGYRHFDTKQLEVVYPFGFGLSYTDFVFENIEVKADWTSVNVALDVRNTGSAASKEVVQLYVSAPAGKLRKPYQELRAYAKTGQISPGEKEKVELTVPTRDLSSYDEEASAWIMEKGDYLLRLGKDSRHTDVVGAVRLDETVKTVQLSRQLTIDRELEFPEYPVFDTAGYEGNVLQLNASQCVTADEASRIPKELKCYTTEEYRTEKSGYTFRWETEETPEKVRSVNNATLLDVVDRKITMEEFVATLEDDVLARLVTGSGQETRYPVEPRLPKGSFRSSFNASTSGKTTDQYSSSLGIPACSLADGPAGLHLMGTATTAFPVGMVLAQTFNSEIAEEIGDAYGKEMEHFDIGLCLGPGMNIHRDPLCGRTFEYYSEDPLVTGLNAAGFTNGLQKNHPGFGVAIKHFCCNNQEVERAKSNSSVSERALREIYLKGFEIAVKKSQPATVMSSYNLVNGVHTSSRYDLLTDVLRGEWGFKGFVMTDWDGDSDRIMDLQAGNDIIMGGYDTDVILAAVRNVQPEFNEDGTVKQKKITMYGGMMHKTSDCYNSFLPAADGTDRIEVPFTGEVPEKLRELEKLGLAEIDATGHKVVYKGYDRAYALKRSVLQRNAMRILDYMAYGAPMKLAKKK